MKVITFTEIQIKNYINKIRPPKEMRHQVDITYRFTNNVVDIYETRPRWDDDTKVVNLPISRAKYIKSKNIWRIYWINSNEKWLAYKPKPEVVLFENYITILEKDENGCFWG